jgi:hypothetical protein
MMPDEHKNEPDDTTPDQDALDAWERLPKNAPSRRALPPATGGFPGWLLGLVALAVLVALLAVVIA